MSEKKVMSMVESDSIGEVLCVYFNRVSSQDMKIKEKSRKAIEFLSLYSDKDKPVIDAVISDSNGLQQFATVLRAVASTIESFDFPKDVVYFAMKDANEMKAIAKDAENGTINYAYKHLYGYILNSWNALKHSPNTYNFSNYILPP